jgi:cytosine deaminase
MTISGGQNVENLWFTNARIPHALASGFETRDLDTATGLATIDLGIKPDGTLTTNRGNARPIDLGGRLVLPTFIDSHVHLDKSYILRRTGMPSGGLMDAARMAGADAVNWSADDLRARMTRALERAHQHGTSAMRTHLDTPVMPLESASWQVFAELRDAWRGRIDLQAVALMSLERVDQHENFAERCRQLKELGGVLGAFISPQTATPERLDAFFALAAEHGLDADFHVDETLDPSARGLEQICDSVLRTGFSGTVVAGHCCSLSTMPIADRDRIIAKVVQAGVHVISLPHSNLFLQDRTGAATPLRRGVTTAHELRAAGASIHFASDNVQDPFFPYGDYDMIEVFRTAVRAAHLDFNAHDWLVGQFRSASAACGYAGHGTLSSGQDANLVIFEARDLIDLLSVSPCERVVLRGGKPLLPASHTLRELFAVELS